ncbi:uncharacterized protein LOC142750426 [Rhinoderma darwinii]|uniref:uncharacterized protein LOC142750426 n=1 Tax=Rhinoderma darwinii TaxID=43563 RepID=UPI003F669D25
MGTETGLAEKELLSSKVLRLDEKVSDLTLRLNVAQTDRERFLKEKLELHRRTQELSLELERAQRGREGFNDQVSDLHIELVGAKAQANRQDQEKVQMKEELVILKQVNEKLTTELGQIQQSLQNALEELHQTQAEYKISSNFAAALESERKQLLEEKQTLMAAVETDEDSQSVQDLRASYTQIQEERDKLQICCQDLEVALEQAHEQLGSQIQEQQQVTLYWKERWQQTAVSLKNTEELLEQGRAQCQKSSNENTEFLQDWEILQTENEELCELRSTMSKLVIDNYVQYKADYMYLILTISANLPSGTVSQKYQLQLKDENNQLTKKVKELEQTIHLEHLYSPLKYSTEEDTDQMKELYRELQKSHEKIKELETERSDKELEMRKLKNENGLVLRIELDACRQQLELERSHREGLQSRVGELESKLAEERRSQDCLGNVENKRSVTQSQRSEIHSLEQQLEKEREAKKRKDELIFTLEEDLEELKHKKSGDIKASLEEVDSELMLVREELQKVWDMLKTKDTELEEQYHELESARDQYTECSTEKVRLDELVTTLQKQMEEK